MLLETLFKNMSKGKQGLCTVDIGGAKVTLTIDGDKITTHRVEFSPEYVSTLLKGHAALCLGVKDENAVMVTPQIASHEDAELTGYLCVASDKAERV
jgi:hypothetical protein